MDETALPASTPSSRRRSISRQRTLHSTLDKLLGLKIESSPEEPKIDTPENDHNNDEVHGKTTSNRAASPEIIAQREVRNSESPNRDHLQQEQIDSDHSSDHYHRYQSEDVTEEDFEKKKNEREEDAKIQEPSVGILHQQVSRRSSSSVSGNSLKKISPEAASTTGLLNNCDRESIDREVTKSESDSSPSPSNTIDDYHHPLIDGDRRLSTNGSISVSLEKANQHSDGRRRRSEEEIIVAQSIHESKEEESGNVTELTKKTDVEPASSMDGRRAMSAFCPFARTKAASEFRKRAYQDWLRKKVVLQNERKKIEARMKEEAQNEKHKEKKRQLDSQAAYASWKKTKEEKVKEEAKRKRAEVEETEKEERRKREEKIRDADKMFESWKKSKDDRIKTTVRERRKSESSRLEKKQMEERTKREDAKKVFQEWKRKKEEEIAAIGNLIKKAERDREREYFSAQVERDMDAQKCFEIWLEQKELERAEAMAAMADGQLEWTKRSPSTTLEELFKPPWIPSNPTVPRTAVIRPSNRRSRSAGARR